MLQDNTDSRPRTSAGIAGFVRTPGLLSQSGAVECGTLSKFRLQVSLVKQGPKAIPRPITEEDLQRRICDLTGH